MKTTQRIIEHYEMYASDDEAQVIESIIKMNGGSDKQIIIENLRGWFTAKKSGDIFTDKLMSDSLSHVDWEAVYKELYADIIGGRPE